MADSAVSSRSRSQNSSANRSRARAASSDDDRRPAWAAVEPELLAAHDIAVEPGDAAPLLQFDPRQGTLLGFELPADALTSMTEDLASARVEASAQSGAARAARVKPASAEQTGAGVLPDIAGTASAELAEAVASLQAALFEERRAAEARWRRTRHWVALASAGLVVLLAVSVAQTIMLLSFSHRMEAAQQQTLSALSEQQAALSALASSTSGLSERMQPPREQADSAGDGASATNPQRQAKHIHARHQKEKAKPAAAH